MSDGAEHPDWLQKFFGHLKFLRNHFAWPDAIIVLCLVSGSVFSLAVAPKGVVITAIERWWPNPEPSALCPAFVSENWGRSVLIGGFIISLLVALYFKGGRDNALNELEIVLNTILGIRSVEITRHGSTSQQLARCEIVCQVVMVTSSKIKRPPPTRVFIRAQSDRQRFELLFEPDVRVYRGFAPADAFNDGVVFTMSGSPMFNKEVTKQAHGPHFLDVVIGLENGFEHPSTIAKCYGLDVKHDDRRDGAVAT